MTLHPSKTKYIFFSAGQHTELESEILSLNGVEIERVGLVCETKWFKFLGMYLDDKLSWVGQCAHVYQKAVAGTFMLACLKRTVSCRIRMLINDLVKYWLLTIAHQAFYASRPLPPMFQICSVFQNLPIEIIFLSAHSWALSMELTTLQLGYPNFGVWKI